MDKLLDVLAEAKSYCNTKKEEDCINRRCKYSVFCNDCCAICDMDLEYLESCNEDNDQENEDL